MSPYSSYPVNFLSKLIDRQKNMPILNLFQYYPLYNLFSHRQHTLKTCFLLSMKERRQVNPPSKIQLIAENVLCATSNFQYNSTKQQSLLRHWTRTCRMVLLPCTPLKQTQTNNISVLKVNILNQRCSSGTLPGWEFLEIVWTKSCLE